MPTENEITEELKARTVLWQKLEKLVDLVTPLLRQAVDEAHKVQQQRRKG